MFKTHVVGEALGFAILSTVLAKITAPKYRTTQITIKIVKSLAVRLSTIVLKVYGVYTETMLEM